MPPPPNLPGAARASDAHGVGAGVRAGAPHRGRFHSLHGEVAEFYGAR